MAISIENGLKKAENLRTRKPRIHYSMNWLKRQGPDKGQNFLDCSSFVYYYLRATGAKLNHVYGSTETLYNETCLEEIYDYKQVRRGDIFIQGIQGLSAGAAGHTGIFLGNGKIIHCNWTARGISIDNTWQKLRCVRSNKERYFRIKNSQVSKKTKNNNNTTKRNNSGVIKIKNERWHGITQAVCNVRANASTNSPIVAVYPVGSRINYDSVYEADGYRWISYIGHSGKRRYVAYRRTSGNTTPWIKF